MITFRTSLTAWFLVSGLRQYDRWEPLSEPPPHPTDPTGPAFPLCPGTRRQRSVGKYHAGWRRDARRQECANDFVRRTLPGVDVCPLTQAASTTYAMTRLLSEASGSTTR